VSRREAYQLLLFLYWHMTEEKNMFKRKIVSILLTAALVVSLSPFGGGAAFAADEPGNNGFLAPIGAADPNAIPISSAADLAGIGKTEDRPMSGSYVLTRDIDLSPYNNGEWVPIGSDLDNAFTGTFDGRGYVIRNLKITDTNYWYNGLFGLVSGATLKNIALEKLQINGEYNESYRTGGVAVGGIAASVVAGTVNNCYSISGSIVLSSSRNRLVVGGIFGSGGDGSKITNCYNTGKIEASEFHLPTDREQSYVYAGGIAGYFVEGNSIVNCYNSGNIFASAAIGLHSLPQAYAGGIVGAGYGWESIENCRNTGDVTAICNSSSVQENDYGTFEAYAGGIIGEANIIVIDNKIVGFVGVISNCYNTGDVLSSIPEFYTRTNNSESYAGGIAGFALCDIRKCYSKGKINAEILSKSYIPESYAGGIAGLLYANAASTTIDACVVLSDGIKANCTDQTNSAHVLNSLVSNFSVHDAAIGEKPEKTNNLALQGIEGNPADDTGNGNGGARITAEQAKQQSTYANLGWDFENVWMIDEGKSYPELRAAVAAPEETETPQVESFTVTATAGANGSISPSGAQTVTSGAAITFTVTPNNGYKIDDIKVDGASALAQIVNSQYTFDKVTTDHAIAATFAYSGGNSGSQSGSGGSGGSTPPPQKAPADEDAAPANTPGAAATSFADTQGHWAAAAIDFVVSRGLFNGVSATEFAPDAPMTRAMFATVLARYAKGTAAGSASFGDVPAGRWYTDGVLWAAENGIVSGIGSGLFDPNGNITREQLAVMLYNYAKFAGLDVSAATGLADFPDSADVSAWAKDAVAWAVATGLISGKPGGLLDPKGPATRAEVATILQRFIEN
jgi:hypothetical protein